MAGVFQADDLTTTGIKGMEIPAELKEEFPDLTTDQWDAITRMTAMILFSLEQDVK